MDINILKDNANKIVLSGHRGGKFAYENTLEGFRLAIENHLDMIEFDIWLTKDKVPIVIHGKEGCIDFENETTGVTKESKIVDLTLEQIKSLTLPDGHSIPTFEELLYLCAGKIMLNVEIKDPNIEVCPIVMDLIKEYEFTPENCFFSSFEHHILVEFKKLDSSYKCQYLYKADEPMDDKYYPDHGEGCNIPYDHLSQELVENCKRNGLTVNIYFHKKCPELVEYYPRVLELGVDTIISDRPLDFIEYCKSL